MRHLDIRRGPAYRFIVKEFQIPFETKVLNTYAKCIGMSNYPLPHAYDDMFEYVLTEQPEHFVASYIHDEGIGDFFQDTMRLSKEEKDEYCEVIIDSLNSPVGQEAHEKLLFDLLAVLDFHKLSFADLDFTFGLEERFLLKNLPIKQVW